MRITAPSEYSTSPPAYSIGEKISTRLWENLPQKYTPAIAASSTQVTRRSRFTDRSADRKTRKATSTSARPSHRTGEVSRPVTPIVSSRILNCGRPSTDTEEPPLKDTGRMVYFLGRKKCGFARERRPFIISSITSRPAITRTEASPADLTRYQRVPKL